MAGTTVIAFSVVIHADIVAELGSLIGRDTITLRVTVLHNNIAFILATIALIVEDLVTGQRAAPAWARTAVRTVFVTRALLFAQGLVNFALGNAI